MKKSLVILYLLFQLITVKGQYPAALPSSGTINMQQIYNWMLAAGEISTGPNSISNLNNHSHLSDKTAPYSLSDWYGYAPPGFICGNSITVTHTAGLLAPVTKTVTYGTVTNIPGETSKCWITSNLGADHQATANNDFTEPSAGWYWQFNRKQGYKHDGTTVTPVWNTSIINESSNWIMANDPCNIELGSTWRIPTYTEWNNVYQALGSTPPFSSGLKLHQAGYINSTNGVLYDRGNGAAGHYYTSTQYNNTLAWQMYFNGSGTSFMYYNNEKTYGFSLRCIKN